MTHSPEAQETVTLHVPFRWARRGGRKEMQLPADVPKRSRPDDPLVKALARAFRWQRMLESGEFATVAELANREKIAPSYLTRILRLTLLAPQIVEAITDGRHGPDITLARLTKGLPDRWDRQCSGARG